MESSIMMKKLVSKARMIRREFSSNTAAVVGQSKKSNTIRSVSTFNGVNKKNVRPSNVGILATDIYFPSRFVSQEKLEKFDNVSAGRYTVGLGQQQMSFAGPEEDINSMCMSVLDQLLTKYNISPKDIGFLGVGTETLIDKSKSTKTHLMKAFADEGNTDIEGVTTINACYGGTAALLHAVDWVESSSWDGRYAIVIAGDIAVYSPGNARPTGGAGTVAMLIGPDAPIVMERGVRASHFEDVYDFYKPNMLSEYPLVDGALSNTCYIRSIDQCYQLFAKKFERAYPELGPFRPQSHVQHAVFHLPYTKLVQKSFARFAYDEMIRNPQAPEYQNLKKIAQDLSLEATYSDKNVEKECLSLTKTDYEQKVFPSTMAGRRIGNMYAGSLYGGLLSLIAAHGDNLVGQRALMFSYGSGLAATMFSLYFNGSVEIQRENCDLLRRLDERTEATPEEFTATLAKREEFTSTKSPVTFNEDEVNVPAGAFYVSSTDKLLRRTYAQKKKIANVDHQQDQQQQPKRKAMA